MKRILFSFVLAIAVAACNCPQDSGSGEGTLSVMSWNVWHAGHSKEIPQKGCENAIGIIRASGADVVLMIETYGCSDNVADSLGYYHRLISDNLSVYSRYPIVKTYKFPEKISTFNFGGVELDVNGKHVRVFDTWLHYLPDARQVPVGSSEPEILAWDDAGSRDEEIRAMLSVLGPMMAESDSIPIIMGGDFNSHSHLDWTDATKDMYNHGGATVRWTVSKEMENAGFRDSFRKMNPDPVSAPGATWFSDEQGQNTRMDRIDFIYYKGSGLKPVRSEIHNAYLMDTLDFHGEKFLYPSDHGFVLTEFSLE